MFVDDLPTQARSQSHFVPRAWLLWDRTGHPIEAWRETDRIKKQGKVCEPREYNSSWNIQQSLLTDLCFFQTQDGRVMLLVAENWYCLLEIVIFIHKAVTVYKGILHKCHLAQSSQARHIWNLTCTWKVWLGYMEQHTRDHRAPEQHIPNQKSGFLFAILLALPSTPPGSQPTHNSCHTKEVASDQKMHKV